MTTVGLSVHLGECDVCSPVMERAAPVLRPLLYPSQPQSIAQIEGSPQERIYSCSDFLWPPKEVAH